MQKNRYSNPKTLIKLSGNNDTFSCHCFHHITHTYHLSIFLVLLFWCRSRTEECHWQAGPVCCSEWARVWKNDHGETEGQPKVLLSLWRRILQLLQVQAFYGAAAAYVVKGTVHYTVTCRFIWCWESSVPFVQDHEGC